MIGIISDSHDNLEAIAAAVRFFNEKKVTAVLHAGDLISPFTARGFKALDAKLYFVFGNNDGDRLLLKQMYSGIDAECCGDFGELDIEGHHIALLHGTYEPLVDAIAASGKYDIVVRGHTHNASVKKEGNTLVINPGELSGILTGKRTLAILDTDNNVELIEF